MRLRKAPGACIDAGRRGEAPPAGRVGSVRRSANGSGASNEGVAAIRAWAVEHGYAISSRGRIPADIRKAYAAAS